MKTVFVMLLTLISFCAQSYEDVTVNWEAKTIDDWEIIPAVLELQSNIPGPIRSLINKDLEAIHPIKAGKAYTYVQDVREVPNGMYQKMAVEYSSRLVNVAYEDFIKIIPPHNWGEHLYNLIGRGISQQEVTNDGRVTKQVERMVLKNPGQDMDMTKVEVIQYEDEKVIIYWRVRASDNNTTDTDIGMLEIKKHHGCTLVTFHSAHRLRLFGLSLPRSFIHRSIGNIFLKHLANYNTITKNNTVNFSMIQ